MTYEEGMLDLAAKYVKELQEKGEVFLELVGGKTSVRSVLVVVYQILVNKKVCPRLEDMETDDKRELWNEARRICPTGSKEDLISVCKALHGFGVFIQVKDSV